MQKISEPLDLFLNMDMDGKHKHTNMMRLTYNVLTVLFPLVPLLVTILPN